MQHLEQAIGLKVTDFTQFVPTLREAVNSTSAKYFKETPSKLQMIDSLVILSLATFLS